MRIALPHLLLILSLGLATPGAAQQVSFGGLRQDPSLPVEVLADQLAVDQANGAATFSGNVRVRQGELILSAATIRVEYAADAKRIARLHATGGVTVVAGPDAAEARDAVYAVDAGQVTLTGQVLLTQGGGSIAGEKLVIDLKTGAARMDGRVRSTFQPGGN